MGYLSRVFLATEEENRRAILAALPPNRGGDLLDVGPHDGAFTVRVAERVGAQAKHGVELVGRHAERARARGIDVVHADIERGLPFDEGRFRTVTANQVIEHVRRTDSDTRMTGGPVTLVFGSVGMRRQLRRRCETSTGRGEV